MLIPERLFTDRLLGAQREPGRRNTAWYVVISRLTVLQPPGDDAQRERLNSRKSRFLCFAVRENAGELDNPGQPAASGQRPSSSRSSSTLNVIKQERLRPTIALHP
jgi:hypothetical protein